MKKKLVTVICCLIPVGIVYIVATSLRNQELDSIQHVVSNPSNVTIGVVTNKTVYKGRSITVRYEVNDVVFKESDGINENDKVEEGDSVLVRYAIDNPALMITEFSDEFVMSNQH
ncbi:MAG: hypothetical protein ACO1N9_00600 [Flavobacterium sp.]